MDKDLLNKISLPLQRLTNRYSFLQKEYSGFYSAWNKNMTVVRGENLEFLKQFEEIPCKTFLKEEGRSQFSEDYMNSPMIIITEDFVKIHQEAARVLFYYLINELKNSIEFFLRFFAAEAFSARFIGNYKEDNGKIRIHPKIADQVLAFFDANVEEFNYVFHVLNKNCKDAIYCDYNGNLVFNLPAIRTYLDSNDKYFDFKDFKIK